MTTKQFRRMTVFAIRMVPVSIGAGRKGKLREHVCEILSRLNCENFGIHYSTIADWDNHEPIPGDDGTCGFAWDHPHGLLCDMVTEYCWDNGLEKEKEYADGRIETIDTKTGIALRCCIRAACDVAVAPSAGVLGFTVGDLRFMWKGKPIPKWVTEYFKDDINQSADDDGVWL